ncbi:basic blue protein [Lolium perenne]|uniref:basic blue protein n=1 Tax=Lolium perenne TaxID=4522 RepID=UPI0021F58C48|nr:stellacyanin-like [Lolium perenne]
MAATRALLLAVVSMAALLGTALGASYTVGAPSGSWDLKTNYTRWASGVKLYAGDQLRFQYTVAEHNVVEVTKSGYDACNGSNNTVATYQIGNDTIPLTAAGSRYFICGVPGHCAAGMKLQVNVSSQLTPPPPPPPPQQQCRMRKGKLRCNRPASPSSSASAAAAVDRSAVAWQRLAAVVVAGLVLLC